MLRNRSRLGILLVSALAAGALAGACGDSGSSSGGTASTGTGTGTGTGGTGGNGGGNTGGNGGDGGDIFVGPSTGVGGGQMQGFDVQPAAPQEITVQLGQTSPTVAYTATLDGNPIGAGWSIDRGEIGSITPGPSSAATFTPKGTAGGLVKVRGGLNGQVIERSLLVKLVGTQNGYDPANPAVQSQIATSVPGLTQGGGIGGVGGEGLGVGVMDPNVIASLDTPAGDGAAEGLKFLYPYDKTVWPRGMLAPLIQWDSTLGDVEAIKMELQTTSGSFSWKGTFGKPQILSQTGGAFIRHPIPQDVWAIATNTAGGATLDGMPDKLILKLTVAKGGVAYGPITETWTVAPGRLSGVIYYNSYGTKLAKNYPGAIGGDGMFGGAVLSIKVGDTAPQLAAGKSGPTSECRVCHSVGANGSRLVAEGESGAHSVYDLTPMGNVEKALANGSGFPGITPDGALALNTSGQLISLANGGAIQPVSGLNQVTTNVGTPSFSPDGKLVALNPMTTPTANPTQKLIVMNFDQATGAFSNPVTAVDLTGQPVQTRPGWAAFFPDGKSLVYHHQIAAGSDGNNLGDLRTRKGAKAYIALASAAGGAAPVPLDQLNGKDAAGNVYLPKLAAAIAMGCTGDGVQVGSINADHGDDVNMNYEPTVNPIASGGYVWVVFTSRRMYGSVAKIPPYCSDPRGVELFTNITPKKLWVAAVDLNAPAGTDPSHPAFYLPAQELLAGNARGFWVLEPCRNDGVGCETGDQCCNGYCNSPDGNSPLVCSDTPPGGMCAGLAEKCTPTVPCCDPKLICLNGFCAQEGPK